MKDAFAHIEHWVFDLDNTLYSPRYGLFRQVDERMGMFISRLLDVDRAEARRIQKRYFVEYGTTLNGLMARHGMDPGAYLDFVHDIDHSVIPPDPALDAALSRLAGRKMVFTNGTVKHAEAVMNQLGITRHFDDIHDIADSAYEPKPRHGAYERFLTRARLAPERAVMFEDIARNLEAAHSLGMVTVLVDSAEHHPDQEFGLTGNGAEAHVDYVTDDLTGFLNALA